MESIVYSLNTKIIRNNDNSQQVTYGVDVLKRESKNFENVCSIEDLFFELEKAQRLIDMCNFLKISPVHLCDVIEDELP